MTRLDSPTRRKRHRGHPELVDKAARSSGGLVATLEALYVAAPDTGLGLQKLLDGLGKRAFGIALFVLAIPVCMPFLYGVPQVVALPMLMLALQMAAGRPRPWLPERLGRRRIAKAGLGRMVQGARRWFGPLERLARPRLLFLSGPRAERIVGAVFIVFCASILVPLPATNTAPGVGIAIASLGLISRDGLVVLVGMALGLVWVLLLVAGFLFLGDAFLSFFDRAAA